MKRRMWLLLVLLFFPGLNVIFGFEFESAKEQIVKNLELYSSHAAPQKVYLHLDKFEYTVGETVWFKAYLFDGITHLPYTDTSNIYVELVNSDGTARDMRILLAEEGFANGEIVLGEGLPDGNYVIRAYSGWMENFDEEYFFTRHLYINNPEWDNAIRRWDVLKNRRFNRQLKRMRGEPEQEASFLVRVADFFTRPFTSFDYEVAFFPEGGHMVAGVTNRVAMKVIDPLGNGQFAEGEIVDRHGRVVASLETDKGGISLFDIEPENGNTYTARISINNERPSNYELPEPKTRGYIMRVESEQDRLVVNIMAPPGTPEAESSLFLVGHSRGKPHYNESFQLENGLKEIMVDKTALPPGISHFTVFTSDPSPVAERLVFIRGDDELTFSYWIETTGFEPGYFGMDIIVRDKSGSRVEGNFSLSAVTGRSEYGPRRRSDLLSYIKLSSELQGLTPDIHQYYFDGNDENGLAIDNLLLTHGWRRFDWDKVITADFPDMERDDHRGLVFRGRLMDPAKNESLRNYPVQLQVGSGHDETFETTTGSMGYFAFKGLYYEGQVNVALSSRRLSGNYPPEITLDLTEARGYDYEVGFYTQEKRITSRGDDWSRRNRPPRGRAKGSTRDDTTDQLYGVPDQTIYIDYETSTERSLYEILRNQGRGMSFEGGNIIIRGPSSLVLSNEPRYMIDGVFVDADSFLNMYPREVERIEVFSGSRAAIFGIRGGTGVILAYSRRPGYAGFEDTMEMVMLGYHSPSEFYLDLVSVEDLSPVERRGGKTIHWNPQLITSSDGLFSTKIPVPQGSDKIMITIEGAGFEGGLGYAEITLNIED